MSTRIVRFAWLSALFCVLLGSLASPVRAADGDWPKYALSQGKGVYASPWPAIKAIQYLLRVRGYNLAVDGYFGSQTQNVVKKFQRSRGLSVDGVVGRRTWERLVVRVHKGSRGNAVRAVQVMLNRFDSPVAVDGVFSDQTRLAVRKFQANQNLRVDGVVGPTTWRKLIEDARHNEEYEE